MVTLASMQNLIWGKPLKMSPWCHYLRFLTPYSRLCMMIDYYGWWRLWRFYSHVLKNLCVSNVIVSKRLCNRFTTYRFTWFQALWINKSSRTWADEVDDLISYSALIMKPLNKFFFPWGMWLMWSIFISLFGLKWKRSRAWMKGSGYSEGAASEGSDWTPDHAGEASPWSQPF